MSGLPVLGEPLQPDDAAEHRAVGARHRAEARLRREESAVDAKKIDDDIKVLLVIHPRDMPEQTEYALDQFVLRGGKLIAFVDPYAYFDQQPAPMPGVPPEPASSTLRRCSRPGA